MSIKSSFWSKSNHVLPQIIHPLSLDELQSLIGNTKNKKKILINCLHRPYESHTENEIYLHTNHLNRILFLDKTHNTVKVEAGIKSGKPIANSC